MLRVLPQLFRRSVHLRPVAILLVMLSLVPAAFIGNELVDVTRNVAYWDELDTAVQLLVQLDSGLGWRDIAGRIFAIANEHRMVTSRLMFAGSYWLTGTVNFAAISFIGNASLVILCALLLHAAGTAERRVKLGLILAMLMFQWQHYENLLWAGSSIDHFQVVLLAGATVIGVAHGTRAALLGASFCALLATFTLAHGIITWFIGAAMLWHGRRFQHLAIWGACAAIAVGGFLAGFQVNHAQRFAEFSFAGALVVAHYWLSAMGSVPAVGHAAAAPWLGAVLLAGLGWLAMRGAFRKETVAFPLACYAIAALALIAIGRAAESNGLVHSRYYVLGALAWALVLFMMLEQLPGPRHPYLPMLGVAPLLVVFNLSANEAFHQKAESWLECRDRAAVRFKESGVDGRGPFSLYPVPARSTELLNEAERRGVYRMASICEERSFPDAQPSERITYYVEEVAVSGRAAAIGGWAAIPGLPSKRGQIHVVLRSDQEMHVFTAVTITRPDVAASLKKPDTVLSGFRFARRRDRLPTGEFQIGFLIKNGSRAEYIMTGHRISLIGEGKALLASAE